MRNLAVLLVLVVASAATIAWRAGLLPAQVAPQVANVDGPPQFDGEPVTDYDTGVAYATVESTWDHQPQIEILPSTPHPRMVPIGLKDPDEDEAREAEERDDDARDAASRDGVKKKYSGFEGTFQTPWMPPDPSIAVGPNHIVETVNENLAIYGKDGKLQFSQPLDSSGNPGFFEGVGAGGFVYDPKCFYDELSGRFVVAALEMYTNPNSSFIDIAVSDDSDPNGTWYKYRTDALTTISGADYWVDYTGLGYDNQAFYVCGNLFGFAGGSAGVKFRIFDKTPMLTGAPATYTNMRSSVSWSLQPAHHHTTPNAPFFVGQGGTSSTQIRLVAIENPLSTSPTAVTKLVTVNSYATPPSAPDAGGNSIDTLDGRIINSDFMGTSLVAGHGIGAGHKALARWYQFNVNNWPITGSPSVTQQGNVDYGGGVFTWYPALAQLATGEIGMCMAHSSHKEYAGVSIATRLPTDPAGTMTQITRVKRGESGYSGFRWGDFYGCVTDPADPTTFWGVGEFPRGGAWGTWIEKFDTKPDLPASGILLSTSSATKVGQCLWGKSDVVDLDPSTGTFFKVIDMVDLITTPPNLNGLCVLADGSFLFSWDQQVNITGLQGGPNGTTVDPNDVVQFIPVSLGETTAGSCVFYFDGSDVGLDDMVNESIDALAVDTNGNLLISTSGAATTPSLNFADQDVVQFSVTSLGANTNGSFSAWFVGADPDVALADTSENVDALDWHAAASAITVSTTGDFKVPRRISGQNRDLITFTATLLGPNTNGTWAFTLDGDAYGLSATNVDGLHILP